MSIRHTATAKGEKRRVEKHPHHRALIQFNYQFETHDEKLNFQHHQPGSAVGAIPESSPGRFRPRPFARAISICAQQLLPSVETVRSVRVIEPSEGRMRPSCEVFDPWWNSPRRKLILIGAASLQTLLLHSLLPPVVMGLAPFIKRR